MSCCKKIHAPKCIQNVSIVNTLKNEFAKSGMLNESELTDNPHSHGNGSEGNIIRSVSGLVDSNTLLKGRDTANYSV